MLKTSASSRHSPLACSLVLKTLLHWLPVYSRTWFKVPLTVHKAAPSLTASYVEPRPSQQGRQTRQMPRAPSWPEAPQTTGLDSNRATNWVRLFKFCDGPWKVQPLYRYPAQGAPDRWQQTARLVFPAAGKIWNINRKHGANLSNGKLKKEKRRKEAAAGPQLHNNLPPVVKNAPNIPAFKSGLKTRHFLKQQRNNSSCFSIIAFPNDCVQVLFASFSVFDTICRAFSSGQNVALW